MVRHQFYYTNHFIIVKCIYYLTFIVPHLIIKYDSLLCRLLFPSQRFNPCTYAEDTSIGQKATDFIMRK